MCPYLFVFANGSHACLTLFERRAFSKSLHQAFAMSSLDWSTSDSHISEAGHLNTGVHEFHHALLCILLCKFYYRAFYVLLLNLGSVAFIIIIRVLGTILIPILGIFLIFFIFTGNIVLRVSAFIAENGVETAHALHW